MTNKQDLTKKVKYHFGLNIYESKVWLALLGKGIANVGEIAEMSGVPRSRVYDVLESLEKKGFAIAKLGKPVKFIAVKPAVVLDRMKNNLVKEANERVKILGSLETTPDYKELESLYSNCIEPVQVEDVTSAVKGRSNIYAHMKEMIGSAQKEVVLITTLNALKRKSGFLKPLFDKLKGKNVNIIVASNENEDIKTMINLSRQLGVSIKKTKANARMLVVDNAKMLLTITPDNSEENDVAVIMNSTFFAKTLTGLVPSFSNL
jgi:HTH-type transcriptional regulator, sugar sensing transcriptional regulator